jgi:hypothetical protein
MGGRLYASIQGREFILAITPLRGTLVLAEESFVP